MVLDIILVLFAILGFWTGYSKGIVGTIITVLSFTVGIILAVKLGPAFTNFLEQIFNNDHPLMLIAGFILSFIIVMVILRMIGRGIEGILKSANINFINQIVGGAVLGAVGILVYSWLLWFAIQSNLVDPQTRNESITYRYTKDFPDHMKVVTDQLRPVFSDFWHEAMDAIDRMEDMSVRKSETDPTIYDLEDEAVEEQDNR